MNRARIAALVFAFGCILLVLHSTLPFLWSLVGIQAEYPLFFHSGPADVIQGFTPPLGLVAMLIAGLIYGGQRKEAQS